VNITFAGDTGMPFGGYKQSGIGRECGQYALDTYVVIHLSVFLVSMLMGTLF
jgi:acyl-CoA reductase-like NAD-dependent aldehyde dehydrogenase